MWKLLRKRYRKWHSHVPKWKYCKCLFVFLNTVWQTLFPFGDFARNDLIKVFEISYDLLLHHYKVKFCGKIWYFNFFWKESLNNDSQQFHP
jgi:hypothetical protein